jgi:malonate transporter
VSAALFSGVNYAQLLFPDFSLILCGYLVCRYTALNRSVWEQVESLVYFFLFPVLLFHSIVKSPLDLGAASSLIGGGPAALGVSGIALAYSLPHLALAWARTSTAATTPASAQVAFRFNSFIALALAERLAGAQGLLQIAVLIGVCVPLFNVGAVWPMARHAQRGFVRELVRNPLIIATAIWAWRPTCWAFACRSGWSPRSPASAGHRWPWA